jgi:hypothetical protein
MLSILIQCFDKHKNLILKNSVEYSGRVHTKNKFENFLLIFHFLEKIIIIDNSGTLEARNLGSIMVPGKHIVKCSAEMKRER